MLVFFTNSILVELLVRYLALFCLFSVIIGFECLWMEIFIRWFLILHFSFYTLVTFPTMFLSLILLSMLMLMILLFSLSLIKHQFFWQQLELVFEVESNLRGIFYWGRKLVGDLNAGRTQLFCFPWTSNSGTTDVKMDGSALEAKLSFKMLMLSLSCKLDLSSCIVSIAKSVFKKIDSFYEVSFF